MSLSDYRQRFVFDQLDARGCLVKLQDTCQSVQSTHYYPDNLAQVLNQFTLAATLLRDSIKLQGSLTIQLRSNGAVKLIIADSMADQRVRAIAEYTNEALAPNDPIHLNALGDDTVLAITITPEEGQRYQSIVPIEYATLAECLADYFQRSEQLPSLFRFFTEKEEGLGVAIHALPPEKVLDKTDADSHFERLNVLLQSLTQEEAMTLSSQDILTRLFHQEACRLFDAQPVEFGCVCSAEKSLDAIKALGEDDVSALIQERKAQGNERLVVDCHFCFQRYEFDFNDIARLFDK
jgi:molecular chaperone Hsp33